LSKGGVEDDGVDDGCRDEVMGDFGMVEFGSDSAAVASSKD
jgi:hypothetical protein